ncbi:MAG TPA: hypothetical protein VGJ86_16190 [Acidimicrobiales bacterium]
MTNIHVRNVPDDVAERLKRLAARERLSLNAYLVRQLEHAARVADNAALLADLPDRRRVTTEDVVEALQEAREDR